MSATERMSATRRDQVTSAVGPSAPVSRAGRRPEATAAHLAVVPATGSFDLRDFVDHPRTSDLGEQVHQGLAQADLPAGVLVVLDHLRRTEQGVLDWMRDVLIGPTQVDAEVTAFLTTWAYEKYWLGQTVARISQAHRPPPPSRPGLVARIGDQLHERLWPSVATIGTNLTGPAVTAGYLARALADTLAQRVTIIRLAQICPPLLPLTRTALHTTERHVAFFAHNLRRRAAHAPSRAAVHLALRTWRWPGGRYGDRAQVAVMLRYLLGHVAARAPVAQADEALARLPGAPGRAVLRTEFARFVVHGTSACQVRVQ